MSKEDLEMNKIAASILLAGVIAMLSAFFTNILYNPNPSYLEVKRGYQIEIAENEPQGVTTEEIDVMELIASADAMKGQKIAKKCVACHSFDKDGPNKVGPALWNLVDRPIASLADYNYSEALSQINKNWTYEELFYFIQAPKKYAKGTKMSFAGIKKNNQLADLIAYLAQQKE
ncbi:MAG: c-type cytochrome [Rickettsiales bacterium]